MARNNSSRDNIDLFYAHGVDVVSKTLYLGGLSGEEIDPSSAADMIKGLHILSSIRPSEPISIIINSGGGDVDQGLAIYDAIRNTTSTVNACVRGNCYSMAAWILQAADHRSMAKNSSMMIHDGDKSLEGKTGDIKALKKFYDDMDNRCVDILLERIREKHPGFSKARLYKMLQNDIYLWPEQALELGLIDEVLD